MNSLALEPRECATLAAALAFWQASGLCSRGLRPRNLDLLATGAGSFSALQPDEADALRKRLQTAAVANPD